MRRPAGCPRPRTTTDPVDDDAVARHLGEVLTSALGQRGEMVTRYVVLAEVIDGAGQRAMWSAVPEDATAWDTLGLLAYATAREHAAIAASE